MTDNEILFEDIIQKIQKVIGEYGEENFYLAFSGGKDSTVLSALVDMAIPNNTIPRVFTDTGIEFKLIRQFVEREREREHSWELVVIKPTKNIKNMLNEDGYPFKSKKHSEVLSRYQRSGKINSVLQYLGEREDKEPWSPRNSCPIKLRYQFTDDFNMKVSDKCCKRLKIDPINKWIKENNKPYGIVGLMASEGGRRSSTVCLAFINGRLNNFHPLVNATKEWEDWVIDKYNIEISDIYKEPYNLKRTGCKGCPFCVKLQDELDMLEKYFPEERKQCEIIWKPVYDEYRRIGYRLKK